MLSVPQAIKANKNGTDKSHKARNRIAKPKAHWSTHYMLRANPE